MAKDRMDSMGRGVQCGRADSVESVCYPAYSSSSINKLNGQTSAMDVRRCVVLGNYVVKSRQLAAVCILV